MAGGLSLFLSAKIALWYTGGSAMTSTPSTSFVALSTAGVAASLGSEVTASGGTNYVREQCTNASNTADTNANSWTTSTVGTGTKLTNAGQILWPIAGGAGFGNVQSAYVMDALSTGNAIFCGALSQAQNLVAGNQFSFGAGLLTVTID